MKIVVTSVVVDDQEKALRFYRDVLGFQLKDDIPLGHHRWLTLVDHPGGVELLLEPDEHPAANPWKEALVADGVPLTSFGVDDIQAEYARLKALGVEFTQPPGGDGRGRHHGGLRRHLRQPDPDRPAARLDERRGEPL